MTKTLCVRHTGLRRGRNLVLEAGSVEIPLGSVVALVGANGAGKTSLMLLLCGLLRRAAGNAEVSLGGQPVTRIALVPQRPAFAPWLTVREVAALYDSHLDGDGGHLSLEPQILDRKCSELSGGQRQYVAVRMALAQGAPLTLLDEPLSGIDIVNRPLLLDAIKSASLLNPEGVIVISSHIATDLEAICDRVVVIKNHGYVFEGSFDDLVRRPTKVNGGKSSFESAVIHLLR